MYKTEEGMFYDDGSGPKQLETEQEFNEMAKQYGLNETTGWETEVPGKLVFKDDELVIDPEKFTEAVRSTQHKGALIDLQNALGKHPEKNAIASELITKSMLGKVAMDHFRDGMGEFLFDKLESLRYATDQELRAMGIDPANKDAKIEEAKQYVTQLENLYNTVYEGVMQEGRSKEDKELFTDRQNFLLARGEMIMAVDAAASANRASILEALDSFDVPDTESYLAQRVRKVREASRILEDVTIGAYDENTSKAMTKATKDLNKALEELLTSGDAWKYAKENIAMIKLIGELERKSFVQEQLEDSRNQLYEDFSKVLNPKSDISLLWMIPGISYKSKGMEYFRANRESLWSRFSDYRLNYIDLVAKTTLKEYKKYERDQVNKLRLKVKLDYMTAQAVTKAWRDRINLAAQEGRPLPSVVADLINEGGIITDDIKEEVEEILSSLIDEISDLVSKKEQLDKIVEYMGAESPEAAEAEKIRSRIIELQQKFDADATEYDPSFGVNVTAAHEDLLRRSELVTKDLTLTEEDVKFKIAESFKQGAALVNKRTKENEEYDDVTSAEKAVEQLQALIRIFEQRKDLDENRTATFVESLKNLLEETESSLEELRKRKANRLLKERKIAKSRMQNLFSKIGVVFEDDKLVIKKESTIYKAIRKVAGDEFMDA
jgi:hypothetical protein